MECYVQEISTIESAIFGEHGRPDRNAPQTSRNLPETTIKDGYIDRLKQSPAALPRTHITMPLSDIFCSGMLMTTVSPTES